MTEPTKNEIVVEPLIEDVPYERQENQSDSGMEAQKELKVNPLIEDVLFTMKRRNNLTQ